MRIIKTGEAFPAVYHGKCTQCGCEVECEAHERKIANGDYRMPYHYVVCPTAGCGDHIHITQKPRGKLVLPQGGSGTARSMRH